MAYGFVGKMLWVDLSKKQTREEPLDEKTMRKYLGGYGLGARVLFDRQKPGVDPHGPEAIFGFVTGVLTGTDALGGSRYVAVGKSPLTGGWGDSNSGGAFGPNLKFAGYDAVFFTGISPEPVYLLIDNGKAEIKDAAHLWGKDTFEVQDIIREAHGKDTEIACIGESGEKKALIAAIMNNKGRAAARSGLASVMGSKKLKAVAVRGNMKIQVPDAQKSAEMRKKHLANMGPRVAFMRDFGTAGLFAMSCQGDDAPCKNWGGVAVVDFPQFEKLSGQKVMEKRARGWGCWHCPVACGGIMKPNEEGEYTYGPEAHKPEYETLAMLGSNLLNDDLDSVIKLNDICNRYGLDTISAGASVAFAIECYENGILNKKDTDGLEMTWGNTAAIVAMTEKIGKREGFGDVLADGVKKAAGRIGRGSEKYAMQIGGEEIPAHDTRGGIMFTIGYGTSPTPARHTQGGEGPFPPDAMPEFDRMSLKGRGEPHKIGSALTQVYNASGVCMIVIGDAYGQIADLVEALQVIPGWDVTKEELVNTGIRVETMRQAFNIREGIKMPWKFPDRMMGIPPKEVGPRKGITVDTHEHFDEYLQAIGWDPETCKPSKQALIDLGMEDVAKVLWP